MKKNPHMTMVFRLKRVSPRACELMMIIDESSKRARNSPERIGQCKPIFMSEQDYSIRLHERNYLE